MHRERKENSNVKDRYSNLFIVVLVRVLFLVVALVLFFGSSCFSWSWHLLALMSLLFY